MPKSGGQSGKLGDLYELLWTVEVALNVFEGRLQSITVEPFGDEAQGVEFHVETVAGILQFHSVKRQKVSGDWSIADLCRVEKKSTGRSILGDLFSKLIQRKDAELVFVSATGANTLRELTEEARKHSSASDFLQVLSKPLQKEFENRLAPLLGGNADAALRALQSLQVRLRDHSGLKDSVEQRIASLLYRRDNSSLRPGDVRRSLAEHFIENMGRTFSTKDLRELIERQGLGLRDWKVDTTTRELVANANYRYLLTTEKELINGSQIIREVATCVTDSITDCEKQGALIIGPGGYGKSCILAQCLRHFSTHDTPHLCLRMDSFDPCQTTRQLGHQMGLQESPAKVLAGIANNTTSVLVVDQLDAMSLVSGRNPQMWEVFEELKREAQSYPNMKLLLACRDFDLHHDHRLRGLSAGGSGISKHVITLLSIDEVKEALKKANNGHLELPDSSLELLRLPFHLLLFLQGEPSRTFSTAGELFNRYWDRKIQKMRQRLGCEPRWNEVVDTLTSRMSEKQLLFAPVSAVGSWANDARVMASENVLIETPDTRQYRFFHESFFDYAYARRFCETRGDVIQLLVGTEQHLFRRAQVRQILAYRREHDFSQYVEDVAAIFRSQKVRFHIKRMVASEFRRLDKPTIEEWQIVEPHLLDGELSRYVSSALRDHSGWFDLLNGCGVFARWLASGDESYENTAIWYLESHVLQEARSAEIARLIDLYSEREGEWQKRILRIMSWGQTNSSPEMTAIYLRLIKRGAYDNRDFWSQHHEAKEEKPQFLIDLLATWFDRVGTVFDDESWGFFDKCTSNNSHAGAMMVCKVARDAPEYFIDRMLPRVRAVVLNTTVEQAGEVCNRVWPWLSNIGEPYDVSDAILLALRRALQYLAKHYPSKLRQHAQTISSEPHQTFAYLLLRAWTDNPKEFANDCAEFIVADRRRLNIGYSSWSSDGKSSGESAISRRALTAISPHCSQEMHVALENAIIGYCDEYEKSTPRWRGSSELLRLRSLGRTRLSQATILRMEELERKFPNLSDAIVAEDDSSGVNFIGSPISQDILAKMSDDQWISAMWKYDGSTDRFKGGPVELSGMLREFAHKDRKRFAAIVDRMPDDIDPKYFSAILDGVCSRWVTLSAEVKSSDDLETAAMPTEVFLRVIERLHGLPNRPCGSSIVHCIQVLADRTLPEHCLDIVSYYSTKDKDPESDIWKVKRNGVNYNGGDPCNHGINCVRGEAAKCIESLLYAEESRLENLKPTLAAIATDPVISVRTCAICAFLPVLNVSRDLAVQWFLKACWGCSEICATRPFARFVYYAVQTHYDEIRELLLFALNSDEPKAVENSARQICLAELSGFDVGDDAHSIRSGSEQMRKTAASVYARNMDHERVGTQCAKYLSLFFNDESEEVREEVSYAFSGLSGVKLLQLCDFIAEFIESRAFENEPDCLLRALENSNVELPDVICRAAERVLEIIGAEGSSIATHAALVAHHISTLVVRQYEQTTDTILKSRCLDLIDQMERAGFYGMAEELRKLDR